MSFWLYKKVIYINFIVMDRICIIHCSKAIASQYKIQIAILILCVRLKPINNLTYQTPSMNHQDHIHFTHMFTHHVLSYSNTYDS